MPTYEYECSSCAERFELRQHMTDAPVEKCPECGGPVRKVFQPFGISVRSGGASKASPCSDGGCPFAGQCNMN